MIGHVRAFSGYRWVITHSPLTRMSLLLDWTKWFQIITRFSTVFPMLVKWELGQSDCGQVIVPLVGMSAGREPQSGQGRAFMMAFLID
jgi:hypothetical protein